MANKRIIELNDAGTYNANQYVEVDKAGDPESEKLLISTILAVESVSRVAQDDAIEASCGLSALGVYAPPAGDYVNAAAFVAAGLDTTLKNADLLLDIQVKANTDAIAGMGNLTTDIVTVSSPAPRALHSAPSTVVSSSLEMASRSFVVVDAWVQINYSGDVIDVTGNPLVLRYSGGNQIGEFSNSLYEANADTMMKIVFDEDIAIPKNENIELYCLLDDGGTLLSTSDLVLTIIYQNVSWA